MSSHVRAIGPVLVLSCPELVHVHYTFDYRQNVTIPHDSREMGPLEKCTYLGLESTAQENRQNKNRYVLAYLSWRIQMGLHEEILLLMQIPGHTRCLVDSGFANIKKIFRRCDVNSLAQLAEVVDKSSKSNVPVLYKKTDGSENWAWYFYLLLYLLKHLHLFYLNNFTDTNKLQVRLEVIPTARFFAGSRYLKISLVPFLQGRLFRSLCKTDIRRTRSKGAAHETGRCPSSGNAKHSNAGRSYCRTLPKDARTPVCASSVQ
ncbi:hypothetical protein MAR_009644 [Mya arenaria]|uniref:DUF7869 domain-containing protein n=1 Tax=Mya arenaria TaxID=6604 RepID=A0ABY7E7H8_MYAAR|nr:hypothetical protein MAR_009644 [Mya arenaria]